MRLSTRGKYALEALVLLGYTCSNDSSMSLNTISHETKISEGYLEQLFRSLKKDGFVKSKKGKYGGYSLARPASDITVEEILVCLEGPLSLVKCTEEDKCCSRQSECITYDIWKRGYEKISETVKKVTLENLINDYANRLENAGVS